MREQAPDLAIKNADELPALGHGNAQQLLGCQAERVLLVHWRDVIEAIKIRNRLQIGLVLDQLLGSAVEQADMRIDAFHDLAVELQYQTEYPVSRRMLGPEIKGEIAQGGFGHNGLASATGPTLTADRSSDSDQPPVTAATGALPAAGASARGQLSRSLAASASKPWPYATIGRQRMMPHAGHHAIRTDAIPISA